MTARQHHDHDAEVGVLGGIFLRNEAMARVADLEVEDFANPRHQLVWAAMRNVEHDGIDAIDPITVAAELKRLGKADALGGEGEVMGYLATLMLRVPTTDAVERYGSLLKKHRTSRELRLALAEAQERLARDEDCEGDDAVQWSLGRIQGIRSRTKDNGRRLGDLMVEELDALDRDQAAIARGDVVRTGMPTGITRLDRSTGGYPIGCVSVVLGATGHGKSTMLGAGARAAVAGDDMAFVYSFEDPSKFWAQRAIGQESGVPTEAIARRHDLDHALQMRDPGEFAHRRLARVRANAWKRREVIIPAAGMDVEDVIADVRSRRQRAPAQLGGRKRRLAVFIDYVQVMRLVFARGTNTRTEAIGYLMDRLQWLAQGAGNPDDECAVVGGSQVHADVEKEKRAPRKGDAADSASVVKVPKLVIGINRPGVYDRSANPKLGTIDVLKRNQGDDYCDVDVFFDLAIHTIRDVNDAPAEQPAQPALGLA